MRTPLAVMLSAELAIAICVGQFGFFHTRAFNRAFHAWYENCTPENQAELDRQSRLNELARLGFSGLMFGGMATITILGVGGYRIWRRAI